MRRNIPGYSLLETLVAISVLALCAAGIFSSVYAGFNLVNDVRESITASSIIQQKIEEFRKTFFANMPPYGERPFLNPALAKLSNASATTDIGPYIDANIVEVVITVKWNSRLGGRQNEKRAATLITRNGINSI
jgi:prepilin-type N-terminal cleavage/methylation domain-containing protein